MGSLFYTVGIPLCQYKIFLCNRFSPPKWDETVINTHLQKKTKRKCRNTYTNTRWRTVPLCRDEIWFLRVIVRCEICPGWRVEILSGKPGSCNHHLTAQKVDGDATCLNKLLTEAENRLLYFLASQDGSYIKPMECVIAVIEGDLKSLQYIADYIFHEIFYERMFEEVCSNIVVWQNWFR